MKAFGKELTARSDFGIASGSGSRVEEGDSFKRRNFSIISQRESISLSCLAWIEATAVESTDVTLLVINCGREESMILKLVVISSKRKTEVRESRQRSTSLD